MNKLKFFCLLVCLAFIVCSGAPLFAQETKEAKPAEPSYEVLLQVLVASDSGAQVPASLGNIVKKLKTTFPFSDYRVASSYLSRVENGGSIESRGLVQENGTTSAPVFQDWTVSGIKKIADAGGQSVIQTNVFRFGTRVPVQVNQGVTYEQIGLVINRVNLIENSPTIIGTLSASKNNELIILVLTVRPAN